MSVKACDTALEAISAIEDNEFIWTHSMSATPRVLINALAVHAKTRQNLTLLQLHTERAESLASPELFGHLRHRCVSDHYRPYSILAQIL